MPFLDRGKGLDFFFLTCYMQEGDKGNTRSGPGLGQAHFAMGQWIIGNYLHCSATLFLDEGVVGRVLLDRRHF